MDFVENNLFSILELYWSGKGERDHKSSLFGTQGSKYLFF